MTTYMAWDADELIAPTARRPVRDAGPFPIPLAALIGLALVGLIVGALA